MTQSTSPAAISERRSGVGDHRMRDRGGFELPGSEPRALQERARLVDPHLLEQPALPRGEQRADRTAVAAGRKTAGVAVRERARAGREEIRGMSRHAPAALDLVGVNAAGMLVRRVVVHLVERPGEVDGGRAGRAQDAIGFDEVVALRSRERVAVGGGNADRRRAADDHRLDRIRERAGVTAQRTSTSSSGRRR